MAIYDYDGTTNNEIGKLHDWDGTTSHQLGKGYDWDGTTSHLFYSAEEVIVQADGTSNVNAILKAWNGSNWTTLNYTPGGGDKITYGTNGNIDVQAGKKDGANAFYLYMNNSTIGYNGAQIYLDTRNIDFSGFSTLKFNYNSSNTRGNAPTVAVTNSIYTGNPQYYSGEATSMTVALNTTNKTYTLDVSGISGTSFYICMRVLATSEGSQVGNTILFTNFILE